MLVASKAGINKVLIEDDFVKAPYFDNMRLHPGNAMLVTERDKVTHKRVASYKFSSMKPADLRCYRDAFCHQDSLSHISMDSNHSCKNA